MVSSDTRSVGELERCVEAIDATAPAERDADDRARLTDALVALADAYGERGEFDAEAEMIARLDRLRGRSGAADVDVHLANALANATSVRDRDDLYATAIDPDRIEAYRGRIEDLYDRRPDPVIAAPLARATAETIHANGKGDRRGRIEPLLDRLETVYDAHAEPDVAASLLRAYAHAELYLGADGGAEESDDVPLGGDDALDGADTPPGTDARGDRVARAEELFRAHPDGEVAAGLAGVLAGRTNADAKRTDVEAIEERIGRIEALADRYPAQEESIVRWLPVATANAARAGFEAADVGRVEHWAGETAAHHERLSTPSSATWTAVATFFSARASFFDGDVEAGEAKLERLEALEERYDNPVFAHWLGRAMFDAARCYVETDRSERARSMVEDLSAFAVGHQDREEIEAGLDALRSHAPHLFDEADGATRASEGAANASEGAADATPESTDSTAESVDASPEPVGVTDETDEASTAAGADAVTPERTDSSDAPAADVRAETDSTASASRNEGAAADETADADLPGCGNCGEDGCGNCGPDDDLLPPASGPELAAVGAVVALVGLSVAYTLYRAQRVVRSAVGGS
ncbi:hypothetical protein SAMN04488067_1046 [Halorubrum xinjiangense]|uniref:Tetratricopeptide repeat-containing protein n=1 Tax=Halorubrum xinjiangense TaxID=261291 RepID=A0A1G7KLJ6_9EURY|nr:hypothetical protein [Halorubrum xinjiangense]SDF38045.1 hypothetical protein SAMN04488067_1046 [Halorubrum xinjiangense]